MIQPWTFTLFPLLFVQIYFLRYAHTSSSANLVRKALLPLILFTAWHYALDNCIEPELTNFAANLGLFGTTAGFSAARAVIWAFVDPSKAYVWRAPNPPTTSLSWVWQVFADWRGMNWSFGARIPKPAPLASDVSGFLKAALVRAFACHVGFLVGAFPSVHYTQEGRHLDEILLPSLGLETNTLSTRLASMVQTIAYGLTGYAFVDWVFFCSNLCDLTRLIWIQHVYTGAHLLDDCSASLLAGVLWSRPRCLRAIRCNTVAAAVPQPAAHLQLEGLLDAALAYSLHRMSNPIEQTTAGQQLTGGAGRLHDRCLRPWKASREVFRAWTACVLLSRTRFCIRSLRCDS